MVSGVLNNISLIAILVVLPGIHDVSAPQITATTIKIAMQARVNKTVFAVERGWCVCFDVVFMIVFF